MKRTCKQCGKEFVITQSEINFYKSKNLNIPKRCKECRQRNKTRNEKTIHNEVNPSNKMSANESGNRLNNNSNKPSFIKILTALILLIAVIYGVVSHGAPENEGSYTEIQNQQISDLEFRNEELLNEHYEKHGIEMGFSSAEEYENAAEDVVENSNALHKTEAEDGDDIYYLENTNEFVVISTDGYIRTYFCPDDGIDYYNRQ